MEAGSSPVPAVDGRRRRAERNRDAVVDALLALYDEGHVRPGAALVAERANVSQSTVFRLFADLDGLVQVAIEHQWARIKDRFDAPSAAGDLDDRIAALVAQRVRIYDAAGPAIRAGRLLSPGSVALHAVFAARRDLLRRQVEHQFAAELDGLVRSDRQALVDALDATASLEHVEFLRIDRGFGVARTSAAMSRSLSALLGAGR